MSIAIIGGRRGRRRGGGGSFVETFDGTDAASLGTGWTSHIGTWGRDAGRAQLVTNAPGENVASKDFGIANGSGILTLAVYEDRMRLVARLTDGSNYLMCQIFGSTSFAMYKCVAGVFTQLGATATISAGSSGDTIALVCDGDSLAAYRNDVELVTATDSFNNSATRWGIGKTNFAAGAGRWDNLTITG